jgi:hypothetical protein
VNIIGHKPKTHKISPVKKAFFSGKYFHEVFNIGKYESPIPIP